MSPQVSSSLNRFHFEKLNLRCDKTNIYMQDTKTNVNAYKTKQMHKIKKNEH